MHKNVIIYLLEHPKRCQHANQDADCLLPSCAVFPWNNLTNGRIFSEPDVVTPQVTELQPPPFPGSARDKYILLQAIKSRSYLCSGSLCHKVQVSSGKQAECQAVLLPFLSSRVAFQGKQPPTILTVPSRTSNSESHLSVSLYFTLCLQEAILGVQNTVY